MKTTDHDAATDRLDFLAGVQSEREFAHRVLRKLYERAQNRATTEENYTARQYAAGEARGLLDALLAVSGRLDP